MPRIRFIQRVKLPRVAEAAATMRSLIRVLLVADLLGYGRERNEARENVVIKVKSSTDILDDGYKWRKYGHKMIMNSPYPRNYYRCSAHGCPVKKVVERDREDPVYVVATYRGKHNYETRRF
uniref:WRKY transcription factor 45 n=1 Tax=Santalum album TaxID=35974 RepID=A0A650C2Y7_SANAL|nr:WRKY transcription factor 45 [Santalum album]